ncbi:MAG: ABC transporter ATP-binding protein [Nanoarchaeota archaeon]|nr:ABC transporter ATP-binding protein [Nanoarchaeota archaeon]
MKSKLIELDKVWKIYGEGEAKVEALRGLDLDVRDGEFLVLLRPSGSGKSTAMNMIGVLDIPSKGRIFLEGKDISKFSESDLSSIRGKKIGFVFQSFNLISTLSALENVLLPSMFQGLDKTEALERAKKILHEVGLGHRIHHKPGELSGGEQQRVAIARALINDPHIILADEPTGNLDSKTSIEIMKVLKALHKKGKTIILITHDHALTKFASTSPVPLMS